MPDRPRFLRFAAASLASLLLWSAAVAADAPRTETLMLSGSGPDDAVPWDFRIDGGMRAGENARLPVPSNWQQHGFGHYQYGYDKGPRAADTGVYRHRFRVPADWQGRTVRIVFDAAMTDTTVKVNGQLAGPVHQGGFNRFSHDVTRLVKVGEDNELEVQVSEASANRATDVAERHGDYWVFGGIYRPVWLEAAPAESIAQVAIDAKARPDGGGWDVYTHGGRKNTGLDAVGWARRMAEMGAGEILLTSMDRDGTKIGFDLALTRAVSDAVLVPVIASGGVGALEHLSEGIRIGGADAVLAASIFHYGTFTVGQAKALMARDGIPVRQ